MLAESMQRCLLNWLSQLQIRFITGQVENRSGIPVIYQVVLRSNVGRVQIHNFQSNSGSGQYFQTRVGFGSSQHINVNGRGEQMVIQLEEGRATLFEVTIPSVLHFRFYVCFKSKGNKLIMGRQPCCDKVGVKKGPWTPEERHLGVIYKNMVLGIGGLFPPKQVCLDVARAAGLDGLIT
ncbi:hypothetical protein F3Y22_tig00110889pilonHSYRG00094 [Hibiscus syriacus]|uniref:Uncharacterized protein n=1 Tax=Hibiscus syriacus TaxID=106335 RepID=A0A6A2ZKW2_HIBSY|nr:hypothetical protein F3Y22_tig00110889pilonHSYRG00094 [Hibiscus syriacus]